MSELDVCRLPPVDSAAAAARRHSRTHRFSQQIQIEMQEIMSECLQNAQAWMPRGAEWKLSLREVKQEYLDGRYRHCAARCRTLLDGARHSGDHVQVAHLIYLHFYAASALEMQVRNLYHSSSYRRDLLEQTRDHYRQASILSESEHEVVGRLLGSLSSELPLASPSPRTSVSSQASGLTRSSSPALTICSEDEEPRRPKTVHFASTIEEIDMENAGILEPVVRPDSPTLGGFGDWDNRPSPASESTTSTLEPSTKCRPTTPPPPPSLTPQPDPLKAVEHQLDQEQLYEERIDYAVASRLRSLATFSSALVALRHQINGHMASLEGGGAKAPVEKHARTASQANAELRALELQVRVNRLRAAGWPRPRFDADRYETLRENALAELMD